jgi:hypothetical protein
MSTQAITLCQQAYMRAQEEAPQGFADPEFPQNICQQLINDVLRDMNRMGNFGFMQASTALAYNPAGVFQYNLTPLGVVPNRITRIRRTLAPQGDLQQMGWVRFSRLYRYGVIASRAPGAYSKFNNFLELDHVPDKDYGLVLEHYRDIPLAQNSTDLVSVPMAQEDVLRDGIYALLLQALGRSDFSQAYQLFQKKVNAMTVTLLDDVGIPAAMPASW